MCIKCLGFKNRWDALEPKFVNFSQTFPDKNFSDGGLVACKKKLQHIVSYCVY